MKRMLNNRTAAVFAAAVLLIVFILTGCRETRQVSKTALKMDTVVTVTVYGSSDSASIDSAFAEADRLISLLDIHNKDSEIYSLSEKAGEWVTVSPETYEILTLAKEFYLLSGGYFDVTAAPLVELWNVNGGGYLPTESEIKAAAEFVDGSTLELEDGRARIAEGMKVDLGGIAKGYIADSLKDHLVNLGVEHAVIDIGGNVVLIGSKPDGSKYNVGVKDPLDADGPLLEIIACEDESLVSSGIYERFFEYEGQRYHHILDPFTGKPSESDLAGVTIICSSSARGDALSTSCMLLGCDKGMALVENTEDAEAIFVTRRGDVLMSSGMKARIG